MRRLLFIHGVAQGGRDPVDIKAEWTSALADGCRAAGITWDRDIAIDLPFYGDRLDAHIEEADAPAATAERNPSLERTASQMLLELHASHPALQDAVARAGVELVHEAEKVALNSHLLRAISEAIDQRGADVETFLISRLIKEVHFYVDVPDAQRDVDAIIDAAITGEETVVVAHSLGTVVSYRALLRNPDAPFVKHVTVGCPLGCAALRGSLGPPQNPLPNAWFNARDAHDFVAFQPLDDEHFKTSPPITNDNSVINNTPNRHGISGYLSNPGVATAIMAAVGR